MPRMNLQQISIGGGRFFRLHDVSDTIIKRTGVMPLRKKVDLGSALGKSALEMLVSKGIIDLTTNQLNLNLLDRFLKNKTNIQELSESGFKLRTQEPFDAKHLKRAIAGRLIHPALENFNVRKNVILSNDEFYRTFNLIRSLVKENILNPKSRIERNDINTILSRISPYQIDQMQNFLSFGSTGLTSPIIPVDYSRFQETARQIFSEPSKSAGIRDDEVIFSLDRDEAFVGDKKFSCSNIIEIIPVLSREMRDLLLLRQKDNRSVFAIKKENLDMVKNILQEYGFEEIIND